MDIKKRILATVGIVVVLIIGFYFITGTISKYTGYFVSDDILDKKSDFEVCLAEKDITLYINSENSDVTLKYMRLKEYFDEIDIFNCLRNNRVCLNNNIRTFPSWKIEGRIIPKDISFSELAQYSGCKF